MGAEWKKKTQNKNPNTRPGGRIFFTAGEFSGVLTDTQCKKV